MIVSKRDRDVSLDVIRALAVVSVLAVHFFLNCQFYDTVWTGKAMAPALVLRTQLMVCVPLFLLLSGYLQKEKQWSWGYYKGLLKLLLTYVLASVVCCVFRAVCDGGPWAVKEWLRGMLSFSAAPYGWYIELYMGLFCMIPFLNLLWNALPSRRVKWVLLLTLCFFTMCPSLNVISVHFGWQTVPNRWAPLYPVTYYFIGCFLQESRFHRHWQWFLPLNILSALCGGLLHAYQARGEVVGYMLLTHWNGVFPFVCAVSIFIILQGSRRLERIPGPVRKGITQVSKLSLPIFLLSWVPDQLVYTRLCQAIPDFAHRLPWIVVTVPVVLVLSVFLAKLVLWVQRGIEALCAWVLGRLRTRFCSHSL